MLWLNSTLQPLGVFLVAFCPCPTELVRKQPVVKPVRKNTPLLKNCRPWKAADMATDCIICAVCILIRSLFIMAVSSHWDHHSEALSTPHTVTVSSTHPKLEPADSTCRWPLHFCTAGSKRSSGISPSWSTACQLGGPCPFLKASSPFWLVKASMVRSFNPARHHNCFRELLSHMPRAASHQMMARQSDWEYDSHHARCSGTCWFCPKLNLVLKAGQTSVGMEGSKDFTAAAVAVG